MTGLDPVQPLASPVDTARFQKGMLPALAWAFSGWWVVKHFSRLYTRTIFFPVHIVVHARG
jgi:hypothetical protein